jgi:hydroxymethylpyrimidine pyrophosphatase-like HAD family hydrolase
LPGLIQFAQKFHHPERIYYSTSNGTCLYDPQDRLLYSSFIPYTVFLKMAELYAGHDDWTYMCYAPGNVVGYLGKPNFAPEEARFNKMTCEDFTGKVFPSDYQIEKASLTTGSTDAHTLPLYPELGAYQSYATSSFFFEIVAKDVSKAKTVALLAEKLGVLPDDVYTFGDGENDLSMVASYHGTATGNAIEKVKQAAQFVAPSAAERGVAFAIKEHWKLI